MGLTPRKRRVLLADDHVILLEGLRRLLEAKFDIVGTATDGRALIEAAEQLQPDVIVFDLSMPLVNGFEAARILCRSNPGAKLIVLTMHSDLGFVREALEAGVSGYVVKHSAASELATAIDEVMRGRTYLSAPLRDKLRRSDRKLSSRRPLKGSELTPRQREVLQLLAEGRASKDIAWRLHVAPKTVEYHKYRIMSMLGLHSIAELTAYAIRHGIIEAG